MSNTYWVQYRTGAWHAWHHAADTSVCRRLNKLTLQQHPPLQLKHDLSPELRTAACGSCLSTLGLALPTPDLDVRTREWLGKIRIQITTANAKVAQEDMVAFAERMAAIGSIHDIEAQEAYNYITSVLLRPSRLRGKHAKVAIPNFKAALRKIPPERSAILKVATAVRMWRKITGRSLGVDRINSSYLVEAALEIPQLEPYIERMNEKGFSHMGAMFHPNTVERAKSDAALRGMFDGSGEYWQDTLGQLNVVED